MTAVDARLTRPLPDAGTLTWGQSQGRACIWCRRLLSHGAVMVGVIHDRVGAHRLRTEVWAGPCCLRSDQ
ncbi:hypothetical protein [Streptomyces sp. TE33382]